MNIATPRFTAMMIRLSPWPFFAYSTARLITFLAPFVVVLIEQALFNRFGRADQTATLWWFVAAYAVVLCVRLTAVVSECWTNITFRYRAMGTLQHNTVAAVCARNDVAPAAIQPLEHVNRLRDDAGEVADFPLWLPEVIGTSIATIAAFTVMWRINPQVTLLASIPFVVQGVFALAFWRVYLRYRYAEGALNDEASITVGTLIANALPIRLLQIQQRVTTHVEALGTRRRRNALAKIATQHLATDSTVELSIAVASLIGLWYLLPDVTQQRIGVGDILVFVTGVGIVAGLPQTWATFVGDYAQQHVSIGRLTESMRDPHALIAQVRWWKYLSPQPLQPHPYAATAVSLKHARYIHPDGRGVYDLSIELPAGSFTVVTGRVGAGKSTMLELIAGLRQTQTNTPNAVADDGPDRLDPHVAMVPQRAYLASATLRDNICWGADATHLARVLTICQLDADIAHMPAGLDTIVGPRGMRLSGGQRQRVALARALLRDPGVLVLDDVSSALDAHTEAALLRALRADRSRTIVASSTRPAFLRAADTIVLLDEGHIIAMGSLEALSMSQPAYTSIWQSPAGPSQSPIAEQ